MRGLKVDHKELSCEDLTKAVNLRTLKKIGEDCLEIHTWWICFRQRVTAADTSNGTWTSL